ncbi:acyl-CoA dehydrogenase family protein [Sphingomonas colocasiae]|uniref:Acyl-CoA/acyl-ACP dehydrogenase n=1 Tax=Sphingomonas colocasiae TaxID=1848973 RepID=A0ABS7PVB0_9SPHN|nr:acyl-CoA dehydrogenase family protein [Sphingomonas colocasiae]MBY8824312.1 acyl-CoA/acyl-ACP dehydrogenase [Sphingomonas colocasiae]
MNFTLSDDHIALRDSARGFLEKEVDLAPLLVPGATVEQAGYGPLWTKAAGLGWPGMVVPEAYGGLGMDYLDLIMVIGEAGRTLASMPLFGTLAGSWAIEAGGDETQKAELLGTVAAGEAKLALAVADANGSYEPGAAEVKAARDGDGYRLTGTRAFVVDAASADRLVVAAELDGARRWFVVDAAAAQIERLDWRDITREVCSVRLEGAAATLLAGDADAVWPFVRDRLYLVLAAESAAGIEAVLADAIGYANERVAFGRPIGAFQAIKHQLAEIAGQSECANVGVQYAAWALSAGDETAPLAAAMAQSYASEAYRAATHRNIQIFGAIGFTWEMKNHLFYKRARCNAELLGAPSRQREDVVRILERKAA